MTDRYAFDNVWAHARQRLRGLEELLDPGTIRRLNELGVTEGWHCLEIGAGGGTIAEWLSRRVGQTGRVVATDRDTRFLETLMSVMAARGHVYCGRQLYPLLSALQLTDVRAEGRVPLLYAGTAPARWKWLSVEQLRGDIVNARLATEEEIEGYAALLASPVFAAQGFTVMAAWGRRS